MEFAVSPIEQHWEEFAVDSKDPSVFADVMAIKGNAKPMTNVVMVSAAISLVTDMSPRPLYLIGVHLQLALMR